MKIYRHPNTIENPTPKRSTNTDPQELGHHRHTRQPAAYILNHSHPAWTEQELADPHTVTDKARRVQNMFAAIAPWYDLNNRLHSFGRDQAWRAEAVHMAKVKPNDIVLDVACGTGDLAIKFAQANPARVIAVDFTLNMLSVAQMKKRQSPTTTRINYYAGDALHLPIADSSIDIVSIAFGIRNVAQPVQVASEFHRVLRPGGRLIVLEFSFPKSSLLRGLYNVYFRHVLPHTAALIARDRTGAYKYLPQSVHTFFDRSQLLDLLHESGFINPCHKPLTLGIASLYFATKPNSS